MGNMYEGKLLIWLEIRSPYYSVSITLQTELRTMSRIGAKLGHEDMKFERLEVDASLAVQMFADNR